VHRSVTKNIDEGSSDSLDKPRGLSFSAVLPKTKLDEENMLDRSLSQAIFGNQNQTSFTSQQSSNSLNMEQSV